MRGKGDFWLTVSDLEGAHQRLPSFCVYNSSEWSSFVRAFSSPRQKYQKDMTSRNPLLVVHIKSSIFKEELEQRGPVNARFNAHATISPASQFLFFFLFSVHACHFSIDSSYITTSPHVVSVDHQQGWWAHLPSRPFRWFTKAHFQ
jgi:hypothetical protein